MELCERPGGIACDLSDGVGSLYAEGEAAWELHDILPSSGVLLFMAMMDVNNHGIPNNERWKQPTLGITLEQVLEHLDMAGHLFSGAFLPREFEDVIGN